MSGHTIQVGPVISTDRPAFGAGYRWDSSGVDSAGFGSGSYPMQRSVDYELTRRCERLGFDAASELRWILGGWYGGDACNGEGILIDETRDGRAFVAWFTDRPR